MVLNWRSACDRRFLRLAVAPFDIFGLRSLLWRSNIAFVGSAMLCAAFAFTFGGVVAAAGDAVRRIRRRTARPPRRTRAAGAVAPPLRGPHRPRALRDAIPILSLRFSRIAFFAPRRR